ncbi:cysteine-rich motor neuron 1 protein-like isoform X2 [Branchiostoma lanceolatum]|uniref:cysteine-rich motor neuron 1 protein-like isoform X2 n=1 Tax=Branchiostoma lanceolatum TaxID=7740 RepID=UPI003456DB31
MGAWRTAILFIVIVTSVAGLSCSPCEDHECSKPPPCKGDIVKDACGCCDVCAKVEGERCGGPWKISGVCSSGLFCDKDQDDFNAVGVCKPKASLCGANSHFSACGGMCRPTCDNPTPICPAVCFPGCACDEGFVWSKDNCIPQKICPKKCPAGSHWSMCGSDCPPSCKEPVRACNKMCVPSCVCDVWDHVWRGDRCVPLKQCQDEGCEYNGRKKETRGAMKMRQARTASAAREDLSVCLWTVSTHQAATSGRRMALGPARKPRLASALKVTSSQSPLRRYFSATVSTGSVSPTMMPRAAAALTAVVWSPSATIGQSSGSRSAPCSSSARARGSA